MDKSSRVDIGLEEQRQTWNRWNAAAREHKLPPTSQRQAEIVDAWCAALGRRDLAILDLGCGTGWMSERLCAYGEVTGVDLADEILDRARLRLPQVRFLSGDLFSVDLPERSFDAVVALEVLPYVKDQPAFVDRLAALLKPGGILMLATANRPVLERWSAVGEPMPGQLRRWVDARELRRLLARRFESIRISSVVPVGDQGFLRLLNSTKLNRLLAMVVPRAHVERAKERALLGHTLMALAVSPA